MNNIDLIAQRSFQITWSEERPKVLSRKYRVLGADVVLVDENPLAIADPPDGGILLSWEIYIRQPNSGAHPSCDA